MNVQMFVCVSTYVVILSTRELIESFQYCLLAVFKCLLNTMFGRSAGALVRRERCVISSDFTHTID